VQYFNIFDLLFVPENHIKKSLILLLSKFFLVMFISFVLSYTTFHKSISKIFSLELF